LAAIASHGNSATGIVERVVARPSGVLAERVQGKDRDPKTLEAELNKAYAVPIDRVAHATGYLESHGVRLLFGTDTRYGSAPKAFSILSDAAFRLHSRGLPYVQISATLM
jgi:hypothetical protein